MIIGERLRRLREKKGFTQGHIEERSGLMKCYISRVENGHTVPSLGTLERFATALEVPLHEIFYTGVEAPVASNSSPSHRLDPAGQQTHGPDEDFVLKVTGLVNRIAESDRDVLLVVAQKMAARQQ
jgi:transcriptional regulator with XRE-family HTH domain